MLCIPIFGNAFSYMQLNSLQVHSNMANNYGGKVNAKYSSS